MISKRRDINFIDSTVFNKHRVISDDEKTIFVKDDVNRDPRNLLTDYEKYKIIMNSRINDNYSVSKHIQNANDYVYDVIMETNIKRIKNGK
jgi:hypothetical protein